MTAAIDLNRFTPTQGWVYLIVMCSVDGKTIVKCGGTKREPTIRMDEVLYALTPQLDLFMEPYLFCAIYVDDVWGVEHYTHILLDNYKTDTNEVFAIEPEVAARALSRAVYIRSHNNCSMVKR